MISKYNKYSKIDKIRIKNFKTLKDIEIGFNGNSIIALRGSGESGKSSVIGALSTCLSNKDATKHRKFIRHGTSGFAIETTLGDGTKITRIKSEDDNFLSIEGNDISYRADKIDRGAGIEKLIEVSGITCEQETKEFINYRSYLDPLLFVSTRGSVNSKVIREALNLEELSNGIKNGNKQVSTLKSEITNSNKLVSELEVELKGLTVISTEILDKINTRLSANIEQHTILTEILDLQQKVNKSKSLIDRIDGEVLNQVTDIVTNINKNKDTLNCLMGIKSSLAELKSMASKVQAIKSLDNLCWLDTTNYNDLLVIRSLTQKTSTLHNKLNKLNCLSGITTLDTDLSLCNDLVRLKTIKNRLDSLSEEQNKLINIVKVSGFQYCPNCSHIFKEV